MKTLIFLCWTLVHGEPVDVDSFMEKQQCEQFYVASEQRRLHAVDQHPEAANYSYSVCEPVEVLGPGKPNA